MNIRYWLILFFLATASSGAHGADWPAASDTLAHQLLAEIQVTKVDILLSFDIKEMEGQLWGRFANQEPAKRYGGIEVPGSVQVWPIFKKRILEVAKINNYDHQMLGRILDEIERAEKLPGQYRRDLPFGAYLARQGRRPVWLIPCVWERGITYGPDKKPKPLRLGHIRVWAYFADTAEKAGYMTCK